MVSGYDHILCSHVFPVVAHMDHGAVADVIFGVSGCESWLVYLVDWLVLLSQRVF